MGAVACAHSTSSEVSSAQTLWPSWSVPLFGGGGVGGGDPCTLRMLNAGIPLVQVTPVSPHMCCRPNWVSKLLRSDAMVDEPNESTSAIVLPAPLLVRLA